jgi:hypothetical protein
MEAEMKTGDTLLLKRDNGVGMTIRYLLPRLQNRLGAPPSGKSHLHGIIPLYFGFVTQDGVQQRIVNPYLFIVTDQPAFA